jgi:hypothetical protein
MTHTAEDALRSWLTEPLVEPILRARSRTVLDHDVQPRSLAVWDRHLPRDQAEARAVVARSDGGRISRRDLREAAATALGQQTDAAYIRLFMTCQLWGVGTSGRMHHTATILRQPEAVQRFRDLADAVASGAPQRAAGRWGPSWRTSFTTKYAYPVALARDVDDPAALIYDDRVEGSLRHLGWPFPEAGDGPAELRRYAGYLRALRRVADQLQVRADAIEWLLFDPWIDLRRTPRLPAG